MLQKIDYVLIRVNDVAEAVNFYTQVFGLKQIWQDDRLQRAGLLLADGATEVVLHNDATLPGQIDVYYLVDNVDEALQQYTYQGCTILSEPFEVRNGRAAVVQDPFGARLCIVDKSLSQSEPL